MQGKIILVALLFGATHTSCVYNQSDKNSSLQKETLDRNTHNDYVLQNEQNEQNEQNTSLFTCSAVNARFLNERLIVAEQLLGKPDEAFRNIYWEFRVWYDKVIDDFDNNKTKHLCISFSTRVDRTNPNAIIQCLEHGSRFRMGGTILQLP